MRRLSVVELYVPHRARDLPNEQWRVLQRAAEPYLHTDEEGTHAQEISKAVVVRLTMASASIASGLVKASLAFRGVSTAWQ